MHGTERICVGAVCVDEVWVVFVGVGVTFSALTPIFLPISVRYLHDIFERFYSSLLFYLLHG